MRKAIGLLRVSSEAQAQEDRAGLPAQRREIERLAAQHGLTIVEWTELAGVSGAAVLEDDRFLSLLRRIESPEIEGVVLSQMDRLMRPEDPAYYQIFARFRDTGTVLYTRAGPRDFRNDRLLMMVETEVATLEREKIRERTMLGKEVLRQQGRDVTGRHAYGVTCQTEGARSIWSYVWPEAAVVQQLYEAVLAGERNLSALARRAGLSRSQVRRILSNPIYAGRQRYERRESPLAPRETIEVSVLDPPLVSHDRWALVQTVLRDRAHAVPQRDVPLAYRGFVWCTPCGRPMHAKWRVRTRGWSYRCQSAAHAGGCPTGHLAAPAVETTLDWALARHLGDADALEALLGDFERLQAEAPRGELDTGRLRSLRTERERVLASWERGWRSPEETGRRVAQVDAQIEVLEAAARRAESAVVRSREEIIAQVSGTFCEWPYLDRDEKRQLLGPLVHRLAIERTGRARCRAVSVDLRIQGGGTATGRSRTTAADWGAFLSLEFPAGGM